MKSWVKGQVVSPMWYPTGKPLMSPRKHHQKEKRKSKEENIRSSAQPNDSNAGFTTKCHVELMGGR